MICPHCKEDIEPACPECGEGLDPAEDVCGPCAEYVSLMRDQGLKLQVRYEGVRRWIERNPQGDLIMQLEAEIVALEGMLYSTQRRIKELSDVPPH